MKISKTVLSAVFFLTVSLASAQVATIKPSDGGISKIGEFSEWKKVDVSFDDNSTASIEYRFALATRKGIACHYDIEVKNTSATKLDIRLNSNYYDKFVKGNFGDEIKETLKPGKSVVARLVAQGCKKDKGSDADDYTACLACDFFTDLFVTK